jgi:starch-binding outer membrane protein SusE/F
MKKMSLYRLLAVLVTLTILFVTCTKETSEVRLDPKLSTSQKLNIKSDSATIVGFVIAAGEGFTEKGVCYNTQTGPTITNNKVVFSGKNTSATFSVKVGGLDYATTYYARAYATGSKGTIYGEEITFTTLPVVPMVTTGQFTPTTGVSATGGGIITNDGGAAVIERGVCYDTIANPTIAGAHTSDGPGAGAFTSSLSKLKGQTKYHVRAYAKNIAGLAYGADSTFTTPIAILTWYIPGDYVQDSYPGSTLANWSPGPSSPYIMSTLAAGNLLEGYVYMANATNNWKFASKPNWDGPNYANNDASGTLEPGVLDPNAKNNIASSTGYYKINADATAMTYTAIATVWGIIGDATAGGWGSQTDMVYNPTLQTFSLAAHLTSGAAFKFRGTSDWSVNYGSTAADGKTLNAGGDNIPVTLTDDYAITLDLSHPNAYTYSANRWGIIGDATAGGWSSDQNMTWDATNKVFTITATLTVGAFKFRANDDWAVNYGGNLNALTAGGDNIAVAAAGSYKITFDPWALTATITSAKKK